MLGQARPPRCRLRRAASPLLAALCLGWLASPAPARAAPEQAQMAIERPEDEPPSRRFWMPTGLSVGWRGDGDQSAATLGAEISLVWYVPDGSFLAGPKDGSFAYGLVFDGVWVSDPSHFRGTIGVETFVGLDGSYALGLEAGMTVHSVGDVVGFRARLFLSVYGPSLYVGVDYHESLAAEVGLLLKYPIQF